MVESRLSRLETTMTKLATIQESQTKQMDKLIGSINSTVALAETVKMNTKDINSLGSKLTSVSNDIYKKEGEMHQLIEQNRRDLDKIGQARLWKGLTTAVAVVVFAFGYLYSDIKEVIQESKKSIIAYTEIRKDLAYIKSKLNTVQRRQYELIKFKEKL